MQQKITPFLWFDNNCEEAIKFYVDTFNASPYGNNDSKIVHIQYYPNNVEDEHMKGMEGKVITGIFELAGQKYMALDGGPLFKFNESISFYVECEDQEEVDYFWEKLSAVPESEQCGWLKDKFGVSWQIIPKQLGEYLGGSDPEGAKRATEAMLKMKKIIIEDLKKAYEG